jgi:hypothetical protein
MSYLIYNPSSTGIVLMGGYGVILTGVPSWP